MNETRVNATAQKILHILAGMPAEEANAALVSALGVSCGGICQLSGEPIVAAYQMVDAIAQDARDTIAKHWGAFEAEPVQ